MVHNEFGSLLDRARAAEEAAWSRLYAQYSPTVLGYLRARGATEPEDLLGEVFLQVVRDLPRFSGGEREFRAWLFTVAHHRLLDEVRARTRRVSIVDVPEAGLPAVAPRGDVENEAIEALTADEIRALLGGLSLDQQAVLLLRIFGGLDGGEIGRILGKSAGAVKQLQRRAATAIRATLAERVPFGG